MRQTTKTKIKQIQWSWWHRAPGSQQGVQQESRSNSQQLLGQLIDRSRLNWVSIYSLSFIRHWLRSHLCGKNSGVFLKSPFLLQCNIFQLVFNMCNAYKTRSSLPARRYPPACATTVLSGWGTAWSPPVCQPLRYLSFDIIKPLFDNGQFLDKND